VPKLLDLFCCCGGISKGYHDVGFECTGVDINDNHKYPYNFIHSDVFDLKPEFFQQFDLIHASPPCQGYILTNSKKETEEYSSIRFIDKVRNILLSIGKPFVIENVIGSPLRQDLILCGEMFGLKLFRHRIFEIHGFPVHQPRHKDKHKLSVMNGTAIALYSGGINPGFYGDKKKQIKYRQKRKTMKSPTIKDWQDASGIYWVNDRQHLSQMIPPKYSEYIGSQFLKPIPTLEQFI
jgi:C-5 cytosine-specific DNA methylase